MVLAEVVGVPGMIDRSGLRLGRCRDGCRADLSLEGASLMVSTNNMAVDRVASRFVASHGNYLEGVRYIAGVGRR